MIESNSNTPLYQKMTQTPIPLLILRLGFPTTLSMLATTIYNMADTYFVGKLGTSASGAVGVIFGLMSIIQAFGFMCGHGAGSLLSRRLGSNDRESASRYASTSFALSLVIGCVITVLGFIFLNPLMRLLGSTDTILPYARRYAFFILLSAPLMTSSFVLNNLLRYEGKAALAMIGLISGGILNIFGDWFLMRVLGMGIEGAGLSTAVSQCISFFLLLGVFLLKKTQSRLSISFVDFASLRTIGQICSTGFPSLLRQGLTSISTMLLNNIAADLGDDAAVSAVTIIGRITFFAFAVALGVGQGFQPVSAFNWGAKKYKRVKSSFFFTFLFGTVFLGILAVIGVLLAPSIVYLFQKKDTQVIELGAYGLRIQMIGLVFQPITVCANMLFQSIGFNKRASIISGLRSGAIFIPVLFVASYCFGLNGMFWAQPITDILSVVITVPFLITFFAKLPPDSME